MLSNAEHLNEYSFLECRHLDTVRVATVLEQKCEEMKESCLKPKPRHITPLLLVLEMAFICMINICERKNYCNGPCSYCSETLHSMKGKTFRVCNIICIKIKELYYTPVFGWLKTKTDASLIRFMNHEKEAIALIDNCDNLEKEVEKAFRDVKMRRNDFMTLVHSSDVLDRCHVSSNDLERKCQKLSIELEENFGKLSAFSLVFREKDVKEAIKIYRIYPKILLKRCKDLRNSVEKYRDMTEDCQSLP